MEGNFSAAINDSYEEEKTLISRIQSDTLRLNQIRTERLFTTCSNSTSNQSEDKAIIKKFLKAQEKILREMLCTMGTCKAQGFVYGIISREGKVVTGSSENLRSWWQENVRFHQNGPIAIEEYYSTSCAANSYIHKPEVNIRETLFEISDSTLGSMISALMPHCDPPQRHHPLEKRIPPCWWPTKNETWWTELGFPSDKGEPPYKKPHDLWKIWKTAVLIAIVKNISPDTDRIRMIISQCKGLQDKMSAKELQAWSSVLKQVDRDYLKENSNAPVGRFNNGNATSYLFHNYNPIGTNVNTLLLNNEGARIAPANNALNNDGAPTGLLNNNAAQILSQGQNSMNVSLLGHQNVSTDISRMNMNVMQNRGMLPSLQGIQQQLIDNGFCNQGYAMGNLDGNSTAFHQAGLSTNGVNSNVMQQSLAAFQHQQNMNKSGYYCPEIISNNNMDICDNFYEPSALSNDNMQSTDFFPEFDGLDDFLR